MDETTLTLEKLRTAKQKIDDLGPAPVCVAHHLLPPNTILGGELVQKMLCLFSWFNKRNHRGFLVSIDLVSILEAHGMTVYEYSIREDKENTDG